MYIALTLVKNSSIDPKTFKPRVTRPPSYRGASSAKIHVAVNHIMKFYM
jgi:hypothetical protein